MGADVLVVDPAGAPGTFATPQAAVNAATPGSVILVRPGSYAGDVHVNVLGVALVGEGTAIVRGHVKVSGLPADQDLLISGLTLEPPAFGGPAAVYEGALDVRGCLGHVRVQDCVLRGAVGEGHDPLANPGGTLYSRTGGPGAYVVGSADVAFVECQLLGGEGEIGVVNPSGLGGAGALASDVRHLTLARCVLRGGTGGRGDDPGHGGAGASIVGATTANVAYSALLGGDAGCWAQFMVSPGWTVNGGAGLLRGAGTMTWDFDGVYAGGGAATGGCATPAGGSPGLPVAGAGASVPLSGFPNTLHAPAVVREGQPWSVEIVGPAGERAELRHATATAFAFRPALEQPRLLQPPTFTLIGAAQTIPASQRAVLPQAAFGLSPGVGADIVWLQAVVGPASGPATFSNARFVVRLDSSF